MALGKQNMRALYHTITAYCSVLRLTCSFLPHFVVVLGLCHLSEPVLPDCVAGADFPVVNRRCHFEDN